MTEIGLLQRGRRGRLHGWRALGRERAGDAPRATYARDFGALIVHHCEDPDLVGDGVMNEGELSTRLGLHGIPREAETIMLERDMRLVRADGRALPRGDDLLRRSRPDHARAPRRAGLPVTCGVSINKLDLERERHRALPHLLQALAAAAARGRPAGDGRGARRGPDRRRSCPTTIRRTSRPSASPSPRPPTARSGSRPCSRPGCGSSTPARSRCRAAARACRRGRPRSSGCRRAAAAGRARRPHPVRSRRALRARPARPALALEEHALRRGAAAGPGAPDRGRRAAVVFARR